MMKANPIENRSSIGPVLIIFISSILAAGTITSLYLDAGIYVIAAVLGLAVISLNIFKAKYWLYSIILTSPLFISSSDEGVSVIEVAVGGYWLVSLYIWILYHVIIGRKKVVNNSADFFILFFFVVVLLTNYFFSYHNDIEFLVWFREVSQLSLILFYFPFRDIIKTREDVINTIKVFIFASLFNYAWMAYQSYQNLQNIKLLWELGFLKRSNLFMLVITTIGALIAYVYTEKKLTRIFVLLYLMFSTALLISTLARAFWLVTIVGAIILVYFFENKYRVRYLVHSITIMATITMGIILFGGSTGDLVITYFQNRAQSVTKGTQDVSLQSRLDEYETTSQYIKRFPLGGYGFKSAIPSYNIIHGTTNYITFVHNGYIFFSFVVGIPLAIVYFLFYLLFLKRSIELSLLSKDILIRGIGVLTFIGMLSYLAVNFLTTLHTDRDFLFTLPILLACFSAVENIWKEENASSAQLRE